MATSYSDLKTEIAGFINRNDLTSMLDTFIDQCESEMQVAINEQDLELETRGTVTVTAGLAPLPTGFLSARSIIWDGDTPRELTYVTPARLESLNAASPSFVNNYTVIGTNLRFADDGDGEAILVYGAKFTPLSDSATSNSILAEFPSAYLYGSLKHAAVYCKDFEAALAYNTVYEQQMALVTKKNKKRRFPGQLCVRPG